MFRCPPTTCMLAGAPGCGKSYLLIRLCNILCRKLNISYHSRNIFTEHWDGYNGEKIVIYDDIYCDSFNPMSTTYKEIISLVSCMPYSPSFAHLEEKGDCVLPEYVLMSTNFPYPSYPCSRDAVCRRSGSLIYCFRERDEDDMTLALLPSPLSVDFTGPVDDPFCYKTLANFIRHHPYSKGARHHTVTQIAEILIEQQAEERRLFNATVARRD